LNVYYRFYFPKLFARYDKIIYLDSDTVVLKSLRTLWNTEISGKFVAGVQAREFVFANRRLGLPPKNKYINAGVMLLNLKEWRKNGLSKKCLEYTRAHKPYGQDQDTLNILCLDKIKIIDPRWNAQVFSNSRKIAETFPRFFESLDTPYIIHFLTQQKPWHPHAPRFDKTHYYFDYLKLTPWKKSLYSYWFQRIILQIHFSSSLKIIRFFYIPILKTFREQIYFLGIPLTKNYDPHWKTDKK
jgi:lipopolysaccharide biosynthesis glycosyltransferase